MTIDLRLPDLSGESQEVQLQKIRSYLYQLTQQLQFALSAVEAPEPRQSPAPGQAAAAAPAQGNSPAATFSAIKSLIAKSADIVNAYYDEINRRLEGIYVARSAFGTYSQQTAQQIQENADGIRRSFENIQQLSGDLGTAQARLLEIDAYIKTGLLCYTADAIPVYGVEIGQQEIIDGALSFRKHARLTSDKLSFFDSNDTEVAYISDRKLYITSADIQELTAQNVRMHNLKIEQYTWTVNADGHLTLA